MLNKQKGNMYGFVTHTWNPIKGKCIHQCLYCYMTKMYKRYKWDETIRLDKKCLKDNLGKGNFIFVGSSGDMFEKYINGEWIHKVLTVTRKKSENTYLFQSKNPYRFQFFKNAFPKNTILATTIETDKREYINKYSEIKNISERIESMSMLADEFKIMVNVEPIMDFEPDSFLYWMKRINPFQINVGADSGHNNLPEPPKEKVLELIKELKKITKVHLKNNLQRLLK